MHGVVVSCSRGVEDTNVLAACSLTWHREAGNHGAGLVEEHHLLSLHRKNSRGSQLAVQEARWRLGPKQ